MNCYKPTFDELKKFFETYGGECNFFIEGNDRYNDCWMGSLDRPEGKIFWFGLAKDGSEAYDFSSFEELVNAKVFDGKSLAELIGKSVVVSVGGIDGKEYFEICLKIQYENHLNSCN